MAGEGLTVTPFELRLDLVGLHRPSGASEHPRISEEAPETKKPRYRAVF